MANSCEKIVAMLRINLLQRNSMSAHPSRPTTRTSPRTASRLSDLPGISMGERYNRPIREGHFIGTDKVFIERPSVQPKAREFIEARIKAPQSDRWFHINGEAGTGKTCLLRMLEREYSRDSRVSTVFISADFKGIEALEKAAKQSQPADKRLIIFVDSLDYFTSTADSTRLNQILHQFTKGNAILITASRSFEFNLFSNKMKGLLPLKTVITLNGFSESEMRIALEKYILGFYPGHPNVNFVIESIMRNKSLRELCSTPLYLSMIFEAYTLEEIVSGRDFNTAVLYDVYWERKVENSRIFDRNDIVTRTKSDLVMEMAFRMLKAGELTDTGEIRKRTNTYGEAFDDLLSEGVIEKHGNAYRFFHQTFFEYAAARAILHDCKNPEWSIGRRIDILLEEDRWDPLRFPVLEKIVLLADSFKNDGVKKQILEKLLVSRNLVFNLEGLKILFGLDSIPESLIPRIKDLWNSKEWLRPEMVEMAKTAPASKALIDILKYFMREPSGFGFQTIEAFGRLGIFMPEEVIPILSDLLKDHLNIRTVTSALVEIGNSRPEVISEEIFDALLVLAREGHSEALIAIGELGRFNPTKALNKLLLLLKSDPLLSYFDINEILDAAAQTISPRLMSKYMPLRKKALTFTGEKILAELIAPLFCSEGYHEALTALREGELRGAFQQMSRLPPFRSLSKRMDKVRADHTAFHVQRAEQMIELAKVKPLHQRGFSLTISLFKEGFYKLAKDRPDDVLDFLNAHLEHFDDSNIIDITNILIKISKIRRAKGLALLIELTNSKSNLIQLTAIGALVELNGFDPDEVMRKLPNLIGDPEFQGGIIGILAEIGHSRPEGALALLQKIYKNTNDPVIQIKATKAIIKISKETAPLRDVKPLELGEWNPPQEVEVWRKIGALIRENALDAELIGAIEEFHRLSSGIERQPYPAAQFFSGLIGEVFYNDKIRAEVERKLGAKPAKLSAGINYFNAPRVLLEELQRTISSYYKDYSHPFGGGDARKDVAEYENHRLGKDIYAADNVAITLGATGAIFLALKFLEEISNRERRRADILIPMPSYYIYGTVAKYLHLGVEEIIGESEKNRFLPTPSEIEARLNRSPHIKMIVLTNPNNPTGETYSREDLEKIVNMAKSRRIYILYDEIFSDLMLSEDNLPNIGDIAENASYSDHVIRVTSWSKDRCIPGFRVGYMLADKSILREINEAAEVMSANPPTVLYGVIRRDLIYRQLMGKLKGQTNDKKRIRELLRPHIAEGRIEAEVNDFISYAEDLAGNRAQYEKNLALVREKLGDPDQFTILEPQAAFNMFVRLREMEGFDQWDFAEKLFIGKGVEVHPGPGFGLEKADWEGKYGFWIRISYAIDREELERGLNGLLEFIEECKKDPKKVEKVGITT